MNIGKWLFLWQFSQTQAGRSAEALVDEAVSLGLGMVAIKIADGAAVAGGSGSRAELLHYTEALRKRGISVWGWQYLYGGRRLVRDSQGRIIGAENYYSTPEREAEAAVQQVKLFGLDGYIADPEAEYKTAPKGRAGRFMRLLRAGIGNLPVALCSYRYPNVHRELDWAGFLEYTDYHAPQVYWGQGAKGDGRLADGRYLAVVELDESVRQLRALRDLPFLPVGRAYIGDGHANPSGAEIVAFLSHARKLGFGGAGLWNWDSLRPGYPGSASRLEAIRGFVWETKAPVEMPHKVFLPLVGRE
jgi:hypothetical protein